MRVVFSYLKHHKVKIIIAYCFTFIELLTDLLFPFFLGIMINEGIMKQNSDALLFWGLVMALAAALTFTSGILNSYFASHVSSQFAYSVRRDLFNKIQQFTYDQLAKFSTAKIVTHFTNDVRQIQQAIFMSLRIMVRAPLIVLGSILMAFYVNFSISIIFLFTIPLLIGFLFFMMQRGSRMFDYVQRGVDEVNRIIQENITGMRMIRVFVRRLTERKRFSVANEQLTITTRRAFRFLESSMPVLMYVMNLSLLFILWFGQKHILSGTTNVGDVVAIVNYSLRIVMAISIFTFITLAFARGKASAERIEHILLEPSSQLEETTDEPLSLKGEITFDNVTFAYSDTEENILNHISFTVQPGERVAILGETGSGKTTLFQLIPQLYKPKEGSIRIDGKLLEEHNVDQLRTEIGYVPQSPLLFTGTIFYNIAFGVENVSEEEVIQAAKDAQIHETIMGFPNQYDTVVGQKGVNLSGGQKQRVSIARALVRKPKILLLDDSTSALDLATETKLLKALQKYECTTLMITQKISTAKEADKIILLQNGEITAQGTDEQLMNSSEMYRRIIQSQGEVEYSNVT